MKVLPLCELASMAFRNLRRHRVKTIITTIAVAVSVALYIVVDGWLVGMNIESRRNTVVYETGAVKIYSSAYFEKKDEAPMEESFGGWEDLSRALAGKGYSSVPHFVFPGTLYSREQSAPFSFIAMDPVLETEVLKYDRYVEQGRFPRRGEFGILVGALAARKLRVDLPSMPTGEELEDSILAGIGEGEDAAFIRSLYSRGAPEDIPAAVFEGELRLKLKALPDGNLALSAYERPRESASYILKGGAEPPDQEAIVRALESAGYSSARRWRLKEGLSSEERARFWDILSESGRMDVRIATVIDRKDEPGGAVRHINQLIDARVVGVVNSPNPKTNGNVAFIPLDVLQDEAGMLLEGRITELCIRRTGSDDTALPGKSESPPAIREALGAALSQDLRLVSWLEDVPDYIAASRGDNVTSRLMIFFLFILSFLGIANTMLMAVLERTKELGMMRALGMTDAQILMLTMLEALFIGLIGSLAGTAIGCIGNIPMVAFGIDYSGMLKEMGTDYGYRVVSIFRSAWNLPVILLSGIVASALSSATAVLPAIRVIRMPITETLRFE